MNPTVRRKHSIGVLGNWLANVLAMTAPGLPRWGHWEPRQVRRLAPPTGLMVLGVCALSLLACGGDGVTTPPSDGPVCKRAGIIHQSPLAADETWAKKDGPHHVLGALTAEASVRGTTLVIEAGTTVCFAPGASLALEPGALIAHGTKDQPILFTATDSSGLWGGITIGSHADADFAHVIIENATGGIYAYGVVTIENATIRRIWGPGITYGYYNEDTYIRNTVIDSAGLDGSWAVHMEAGALENSRIVNSGGDGLVIYARHGLPQASTCEVAGSRKHGVRVLLFAGVVRIQDCNLHNNGGMGIANEADTPVNAQRNWWGDPAGPLGPSGDGVSGFVDYRSARPQPVAGIGS